MVRVRPATPADAEALACIGLQAWQRGIGLLVPAHVADRIRADNPFRPFIQAQGENILVAEIDGRPAGLGAREHRDDVITDIWVAPQWEGKGAGSALLAELERQIAGAGHDHARLQVAADNQRALQLYLARGYEPVWRGVRADPILQVPLEKIGLSKRLSGLT
ncbi:GNAT family N-acetyltransferase [Aquamicrobium terrae]|uniref:Ribosomal-protein-alanine N-acetyltransferase n=1 Tax=Aquamicrobium terrae TaxID=1324945 RepID=A0ABV2MZ31_9HYPH